MYGIKFIYNPLIHNGPIPTETFIERIGESTEVLIELYKNEKYHKDIVESSKLLRAYLKIKKGFHFHENLLIYPAHRIWRDVKKRPVFFLCAAVARCRRHPCLLFQKLLHYDMHPKKGAS